MMVIYILLTGISYQCIFSKFARSEIICGLNIFSFLSASLERIITDNLGSLAGVGEETWGDDVQKLTVTRVVGLALFMIQIPVDNRQPES